MGQYYKLTCPEIAQHISASAMGSFVKAWEQVWSATQPAALAYLCSAGRGSHPRDLPWAPVGPWAGRMPLMVGDYAAIGDLYGRESLMRQDEDRIYGNADDKQSSLIGGTSRNKTLKDVSEAFIPIYERVRDMRASHLMADGSRVPGMSPWSVDFFPAKKVGDEWVLNLDDEAEEDREKMKGYYERCGAMKNTAWMRAPLAPKHPNLVAGQIAPDVIPSHEEGQGGAMLWVNLDRCEYVDPAAMGDIPDLVGIMNGHSARAILGMIVHHANRGGGDLGNLGPVHVPGRWRGDRIVLMGPEGFKPVRGTLVTQDIVRSSYLNATSNAQAFVQAEDWTGVENFIVSNETPRGFSEEEREVLSIAMEAKSVSAVIAAHPEKRIHAKIIPPARLENVSGGETAPGRDIELAPSFEIYLDEGKIFIDAKARSEINALLVDLPVTSVPLSVSPGVHRHQVSCSNDFIAERDFRSNHEILAGMKKALKKA